MIKKLCLFTAILSVTLLCGCERQSMTAEYEQETIEEVGNNGKENEEHSVADVETQYKIESNHEFMKNTYRQIESDDTRTRFMMDFQENLSKEEKQDRWNMIKSLPEVNKSALVTYNVCNVNIKIDDINPDYYKKMFEDGNADESVILSRGYISFPTYIYTYSDVKETALSMFHTIEGYSTAWEKEEWPLFVEEGGEIEIEYYDRNEEGMETIITVDKITDDIPWCLDYVWDSYFCMLLLPKEKYVELFGEDDVNNISGLCGLDYYFIDSKKGKRQKLEKKVSEFEVETCNAWSGYLVEE